jgi:hypothetical protein
MIKHGYYVTRLAKTEEMRQSWADIRQTERNFFHRTRIWSESPKIRWGTETLTKALSTLLFEMIKKR